MADVLKKLIGLVALVVTAAIVVLTFIFLWWGTLILIALGVIASCVVAPVVIGVVALIEWNDNRRIRRQVRKALKRRQDTLHTVQTGHYQAPQGLRPNPRGR